MFSSNIAKVNEFNIRAADNKWDASDSIGIYMVEAGTMNVVEAIINDRIDGDDGNPCVIDA